METKLWREQMDAAMTEYEKLHGHQPKVIMLGENVWRERADSIAKDMNRTGKNSDTVVHRLPKGCQGIVCAS